MWSGRGVSILEEFADYRAFVKGLVVVLKSRDEAAGVEGQERVRFMVRVYLGILEGWEGDDERKGSPQYTGMGFFSRGEQVGLFGRRNRTSLSIVLETPPFGALAPFALRPPLRGGITGHRDDLWASRRDLRLVRDSPREAEMIKRASYRYHEQLRLYFDFKSFRSLTLIPNDAMKFAGKSTSKASSSDWQPKAEIDVVDS